MLVIIITLSDQFIYWFVMHKSAYSKDTINSNSRGFALVLSLALLISFVFLLVITLVSQVRQDMAYSDARENLILAKAMPVWV